MMSFYWHHVLETTLWLIGVIIHRCHLVSSERVNKTSKLQDPHWYLCNEPEVERWAAVWWPEFYHKTTATTNLTCRYWSPVPQPCFRSAGMRMHSLHPPACHWNTSHLTWHSFHWVWGPHCRPPALPGWEIWEHNIQIVIEIHKFEKDPLLSGGKEFVPDGKTKKLKNNILYIN